MLTKEYITFILLDLLDQSINYKSEGYIKYDKRY